MYKHCSSTYIKAKVAARELQSSSLGLFPASQCSKYPKQDRLNLFTLTLFDLAYGPLVGGGKCSFILHFLAKISNMVLKWIACSITSITAWYAKAVHFQTQWEQADLVAKQHDYPTKQSYYHAPSPPKPAKDPNTMNIDVIHTPR